MLQLQHVSGGYEDVVVVEDVSLAFEKGKFYGILGPNGSGKSTLLKLMSGILKPKMGQILLENRAVNSYAPKQLAKKLAVLPQLHASSFSNTVRETVALGRYPHQSGFFASWSATDEQAVQDAMMQTGVKKYEHESLPFLSGGEQQRVFIAQALAQQTEILLLDEPTNHLDIAHQKQALDLMRDKVSEDGLTVISVFHDINLASIYCDCLILMEQGKIKKIGAPHEVVQQLEIQEVYKANIATYAHPEIPKPQITMLPATQNSQLVEIKPQHIEITPDYVKLSTSNPLKTISSAVYNAGLGWFDTFINRTVSADYSMDSISIEVESFLQERNFVPTSAVVMLTAVPAHCAIIEKYEQDGASIVVVVTAGTGNAVDATKSLNRNELRYPGTINTWVFINGKVTDEAFYQAMITATEAKSKALYEEQVLDRHSGTIATGTGTDSLLIAAIQAGDDVQYAGPLTTFGQLIGYGVCDATRKAIKEYNSYTAQMKEE